MSRRTGPHLPPFERRDVLAVEDDPARRRLDQLDDRAPERRLPAAGLADDPERLAVANGEVDAVDGSDLPNRVLEDAGLDREVLDEPFDAEESHRRRRIAGVVAAAACASLMRPAPDADSSGLELLGEVARRR